MEKDKKNNKDRMFTILLSLMAAIAVIGFAYPFFTNHTHLISSGPLVPPQGNSQEAQVAPSTTGTSSTTTNSSVRLPASNVQDPDNVTVDPSSKTTETISQPDDPVATSQDQKAVTGSTKVYLAVANYDYIDNPLKKTANQIFSDLTNLARDPCSNDTTGSCYKIQNNTAFNQTLVASNQNIYYLYPAYLGEINYASFSSGFLTNGFHDNSWVENILTVNTDTGAQKYYLYGYQSDDESHLNYKITGTYKITSP